jgi:hypothetical protein
MRIIRHALWLGLAILVTTVAGCQSRLNVQKTYRLQPGEIQSVEIDPPRYEQRVTVAIDTDAPVTVSVFLKRDAESVERSLTTGNNPANALAVWKGDSSGSVEATVPAKERAIIRVESAQKTASVTLKITGK